MRGGRALGVRRGGFWGGGSRLGGRLCEDGCSTEVGLTVDCHVMETFRENCFLNAVHRR